MVSFKNQICGKWNVSLYLKNLLYVWNPRYAEYLRNSKSRKKSRKSRSRDVSARKILLQDLLITSAWKKDPSQPTLGELFYIILPFRLFFKILHTFTNAFKGIYIGRFSLVYGKDLNGCMLYENMNLISERIMLHIFWLKGFYVSGNSCRRFLESHQHCNIDVTDECLDKIWISDDSFGNGF